jgi:hypothetical protein
MQTTKYCLEIQTLRRRRNPPPQALTATKIRAARKPETLIRIQGWAKIPQPLNCLSTFEERKKTLTLETLIENDKQFSILRSPTANQKSL